MTRTLLSLGAVALLGAVFAQILAAHEVLTAPRALASAYLRLSPEALTTPNVVSGILIAFRGFDTLGEVAVLFMVAASLGPLMRRDAGAPVASPAPLADAGEIVESGRYVLLPMILIFGAYVIVKGHLSPGGGFQGGAIVASGAMLMLIADPRARLNTPLLGVVESCAGVAFVGLGVMGMVFAGGFLDPRYLPAGRLGDLFSAGALPLVSVLLGVKVAAELSVVLARFRD